MTKATRVINKYHIKEMLLNGDPQFENFYKEELIQFCEVARELLKENKKCKEVIDKAIDLIEKSVTTDIGIDSNNNLIHYHQLTEDETGELLDILKEVE